LDEIGQALYGETVTKDDNGAIKTHDWQNGQVTSVSGASVTVRSADGTSWTWTTNGDTEVRKDGKTAQVSAIKAGDKVIVSGLRNDGTRTAARVADPAPDFAKLRERLRDLGRDLPKLRHDLQQDLPRPRA
jgi:hypothetical protein